MVKVAQRGSGDPGPVEFVRRLPELSSGRSIFAERGASIHDFANDLRTVRFKPPDGFDRVAFPPLGLTAGVWPFDGRDLKESAVSRPPIVVC